MKSILLSIKPQYVAKILNGEKTIEIRKKFPSDYVGWVYIYCTKGKQLVDCPQWAENELCHQLWYDKNIALLEGSQALLNGKVVARFWCDKVEEIEYKGFGGFAIGMPSHIYNSFVDKFYSLGDLLRASCLSYDKLHGYLQCQNGYAIHITKLEIFYKPKEIKEFYKVGYGECAKPQGSLREQIIENYNNALKYQLTRAPESWCYVEI